MAVDDTPWFIGVAGVQHSAEVARTLAYAATGGIDGIIGPGDFKVLPTPTPSGKVRIYPGAASMVNRYSANSKQSYIGRSSSYTDLAIDPTDSSGPRTDLIVATIRDPQQRNYSDYNESIKDTYQFFRFEVVKGVSSGAINISNRDYPSVTLARINIPASTATITSAMITDLRTMTQTRVDRQVKVITPSSDLNMSVRKYSHFPYGMTVALDVPQWATRLTIMTYYSGIEATGGSLKDSTAGFRGVFGTLIDGQNTILKARQEQRITHIHTSQFAVPPEYRGKTIQYATQGNHVSGSGALQLDYQSTITYDAQFMEVPE